MGWAPLMGQALPRYDYLNPTDSQKNYSSSEREVYHWRL
jgi:hypothetical protein